MYTICSENKTRYRVIVFADDNAVAIVYMGWLNVDDTMCYWPEGTNQSELARKCTPISKTFRQYKVARVLYRTGACLPFRKGRLQAKETSVVLPSA